MPGSDPTGPMPAADPPVVLLGGAVNTLSAARSLGRRGRTVYVLAESEERLPVAASRYVREYVTVPVESWSEWLAAHRLGAVLVPCGDPGLEFLARRRGVLEELGHRPVEANDALVLDLLDKGVTARVAHAAGVDTPLVVTIDSPSSLEEAAETVQFPCALKPVHSHRAPVGWRAKGLVVHTVDELAAVVAAVTGVVVTEIVPGPDDAFCSYYTYFVDGEPLFHFTKRKLRQYPIRWGTGTYHLSEWVPDAHETGLRLFQSVGLVGLGNVEFKRDARDDKLELIECNLRLTAADPMLRACGLDLPHLLYERAVGRDVPLPSQFRQGVRQWHPLPDVRSLRDYRREGSLTVGGWARSLLHRQCLPLFSADDVRPSLANVLDVGRRLVRRVAAR